MIDCPDFGNQEEVFEPVMCVKGVSSVVETGNAELGFRSGPFDDEGWEDPNELNEETAVVDTKIELSVCPPELTSIEEEVPFREGFEVNTSGDEEFVDRLTEVFGMELCVTEVLFPLTVRCDDVTSNTAEEEDAGHPLLEVSGTRVCVLGVLLPVIVKFTSFELEGAERVLDSVKLVTVW
jgi:hypothetical protein